MWISATDQHHFLVGLGIAEEVRPVPSEEGGGAIQALSRNLAIKNLLLPGGLGGTLKVLIQQKGLNPDQAKTLSGLKSPLFKVADLSRQKFGRTTP
jgi:SAM-dependent MidA family methyltransferase